MFSSNYTTAGWEDKCFQGEGGENEQCGRTKLVPLSTKNKTHFLQFQCGTMT